MVDHVPREHAGARTSEGPVLTFGVAPRHALVAACLALGAALAGCVPGAPDGVARNAAAADTTATAAPEVVPASAEALLAHVRAAGARTVVLNVWATWCGPCREEFPDLLRLRETYRERGLELVLVTGDFEDKLSEVREFLASHGVDFTTYVKTGRDMEFINTLSPDWSGALPATFVFDGDGRRRDFWEGKASYADMERRVLPVLDGRASTIP
jgi:thiol-disulfide isomerase/thioredoxin